MTTPPEAQATLRPDQTEILRGHVVRGSAILLLSTGLVAATNLFYNILIARLCFRGIYFPQIGKLAWVKTILQSRSTIWKLIKEGLANRPGAIPPTAATVASSPSASD